MRLVAVSLAALFLAFGQNARADDMNLYILRAIAELHPKYAMGGYNINATLTHNVNYGSGVVPATKPPATMCVAGVMEVILTAINIYAKDKPNAGVFQKIPLTAWTKGNLTSLRANIFMFAGTGSLGTGHTLAEYSLGEQLRFSDLKPGDFINFNRTNKSGHAVVFLGYLAPDLSLTTTYRADAVGFRYFSSQGKGKPDAGLGFRNAYFDGLCPSNSPMPRDCGVIRSNNRVLLNVGRMWSPDLWDYQKAVDRHKAKARSIIEDANPTVTRGTIDYLLDNELNTELGMSPDQLNFFDQETTD